jgi:phospholipid/cholesterol/gamma-HCH transport system substrate-binding protein
MKTEVKVGIFFLVSLVILLVIFEFISDFSLFSKEYSLKAYFKSAGELQKDNFVRFSGVHVGKVTDIKIVDGRIEVTFKVKEGTPVKTDSVASIRLTSPVGIGYINLTFGSPQTPFAPPGSVLPSEEPADLNEILSKVESTVSSMQSVLAENKDSISNVLRSLDTVLSQAASGRGTIGRLLKDDTLYNQAKDTLANLNELSTGINRGKGTLGKLVKDETLYNNTRETVANLGQLAKKMNNSQGTFGKLLNDQTLYDQATEATTSLNSVLKKVDKGQGTLGKLVNDDSLYRDAKNTVKQVEKGIETSEDIAPLQTLSTAFGIFTVF